ncbi:MAG: hypothetical protein J5737_02200 [Bacteroidales bacterium]|nr:hypothetical protein [Bacteroidales bacterium]
MSNTSSSKKVYYTPDAKEIIIRAFSGLMTVSQTGTREDYESTDMFE